MDIFTSCTGIIQCLHGELAGKQVCTGQPYLELILQNPSQLKYPVHSKLRNLVPFKTESQRKAFLYNSCHGREAEREKKVKVPCLRVLTLAAISIIEFQTIGVGVGGMGMRKGETSESV